MPEAFVCDSIRTPVGRFGGALAPVRPDDLLALTMKTILERNPGVDWAQTDDVIMGDANQAGEDNRNVAVCLFCSPGWMPGFPVPRSTDCVDPEWKPWGMRPVPSRRGRRISYSPEGSSP